MPRPESYQPPRNCGNCKFAELIEWIHISGTLCLHENPIPTLENQQDPAVFERFKAWYLSSMVSPQGCCQMHKPRA